MNKMRFLIGLLVALVGVFSVSAEDYAVGSCRTKPINVSPKASVQSFSLVREWGEDAGEVTWKEVVEEGVTKFLPEYSGRWEDERYLPANKFNTSVSNQYGACWLYIELEKGNDYYFAVDESQAYAPTFELATVGAVLKFGQEGKQVRANGKVYYYVDKEDWLSWEASKVGYFVKFFGGVNTIGESVSLTFQKDSVHPLLPTELGSFDNPFDLSVLQSGSRAIESVASKFSGTRSGAAYKVRLKEGWTYTFSATVPKDAPADAYAVFTVPDPAVYDAHPEIQYETYLREKVNFTITPTSDFDFVFAVTPDQNCWEIPIAGGQLVWTVEDDRDPEPVSAGSYSGSLTADSLTKVQANFTVDVQLMNKGPTNYTATVTVGGTDYVFVDKGNGRLVNSRLVDGDPVISILVVSLTAGGVRVDGSFYLRPDLELFYQGVLKGSQVPWAESFLNPETVIGGVFKDALPETLERVRTWGSKNNLYVSYVSSEAEFTEQGDPVGTVAEAYLLDCAPTSAAVDTAKKAFVITAFDPEAGVIVADGKADGDRYGNGQVQVRTAESPAGPYDLVDRKGAKALFYRAYLVK